MDILNGLSPNVGLLLVGFAFGLLILLLLLLVVKSIMAHRANAQLQQFQQQDALDQQQRRSQY